jgi:putative acetyltransferase
MFYEIRPIRIEDAEDINALRRMPGVYENILGLPSERIQRNVEYIQSNPSNLHQFVAVVKEGESEKVVGTAGLSVNPNHRLRHSGFIGIMVHKDYHGNGIGRALMEALIDVADNWLMLVRLELTVFTDNERAVKLYEKCGFEKEGVRLCAAIRSGAYTDDFIMSRIHPNYRTGVSN